MSDSDFTQNCGVGAINERQVGDGESDMGHQMVIDQNLKTGEPCGLARVLQEYELFWAKQFWHCRPSKGKTQFMIALYHTTVLLQ